MENRFDKNYIDSELEKIGLRIKKTIKIYLIGGCAMSLRGLKESTKDIDIVFRNLEEYKEFTQGLFGVQYHEPSIIKTEHAHLEARKMYENKDGFHLDLFVTHVLGKLKLTDSMMKRAEFYKKFGSMTVYLISKEDIFLFKGLASEGRRRDLSDMAVLYHGLNWALIKQELVSQHLSKELIAWFIRRLEEFREINKLDVPILRDLKEML